MKRRLRLAFKERRKFDKLLSTTIIDKMYYYSYNVKRSVTHQD